MSDPVHRRALFQAYDPGAAYVYAKYDEQAQPRRGWAITAGSTTTVTSRNADQCFNGLVAADEITVERGADGVDLVFVVTPGDDTIVVSSAVNWQRGTDGYPFKVRRFLSGTALDSGAVPIPPDHEVLIQIVVNTLVATSVDVTIERRITGSGSWVTYWSKSYTSAVAPDNQDMVSITQELDGGGDEFRVGVKSTGAGVDSVTVFALAAGGQY